MEMLSPDAEMMLEAAGQPFRRMKRAEFEALANHGFFDEENVELLYGLVVPMSPPKQPHVQSVQVILSMLIRKLGDRASVYCQSAFAASEESVPQPDVFVTSPGSYWSQLHESAILVVEVSDASLRRDRAKRALYSRADVEEYWIVNIAEGCVEVYRDHAGGGWQHTSIHRRGETISPLAFPDVQIAVADILPPE